MRQRDKRVVAKTFHRAGLVVPVDKNDVGYRELPETDASLRRICRTIASAPSDDKRLRAFAPVREMVTFMQFAKDECDYGVRLKLGTDLFCHGSQYFHEVAGQLLSLAYNLLKRNLFAEIIEDHLAHKKNVNSTITFVTLSGELKARRAEDGIVLDLPLYPAHPQDFLEVEDLIKTAIGDTLVQDIRYSPDTRKLLVRLSDTYNRSFLESLKVNTQNLPQVENTGKVKGLILTLKGEHGGQTQEFDFYSRYFAPWVGVAEDPVTAFQCSHRGGELKISLRPDGRVDIEGGAALVLEGTLTA
ncbi:phenazine biosynthesis-like domain-containing protein isoform a [Camelus ferus]|nr:phenazine biosynthesis-like domain-containing protein isoform a [Camelus ferus]